ncbi:FecR domain-containing protein [Rapidithrix thailandica]|uniref:FecR domain-containing protein n=1 Tax=Rapidithrix thailandica TaxID=413964 RepID=A0AAW9S7G8_9BACT
MTAEDLVLDEKFRRWVEAADTTYEVYWQERMARGEVEPAELDRARLLLKSLQVKNKQVRKDELDAGWKRLERYYQLAQMPSARQRNITFWPKMLVAASVVLLICVGIYFSNTLSIEEETPAITYIEKVIPKGQKVILTLPDSTIVHLNSESRIKFPQGFTKQLREVELEGEAYFEVQKDPARPFVVKSKYLQAKVLGTAFNFKAFPEEKQVRVALVEGKLQVSDSLVATGHSMILSPTDMAVFDIRKKTLQKSGFDLQEEIGWKDGQLAFRKASFQEIIHRLERWYGVEIEVNRVPDIQGFTGDFARQSLDDVLEGISYAIPFDFQINKQKVTITVK